MPLCSLTLPTPTHNHTFSCNHTHVPVITHTLTHAAWWRGLGADGTSGTGLLRFAPGKWALHLSPMKGRPVGAMGSCRWSSLLLSLFRNRPAPPFPEISPCLFTAQRSLVSPDSCMRAHAHTVLWGSETSRAPCTWVGAVRGFLSPRPDLSVSNNRAFLGRLWKGFWRS